MTIDTLIDKTDTFEIVRTQISNILATEVASQMQLAIDGGKDPDLWKLRIFEERSNPWEEWRDDQSDTSPIVNVSFDNANFDKLPSNISERQKATGIFNIDCYGYGKAADDGGSGHIPGDRLAAYEAQRAVRLVRNILMASIYSYLDLRGTVWQRWPQNITQFQAELLSPDALQVMAVRLPMMVTYNEFAPQFTPETLEEVFVDVLRAETGELLFEANFIYPLP